LSVAERQAAPWCWLRWRRKGGRGGRSLCAWAGWGRRRQTKRFEEGERAGRAEETGRTGQKDSAEKTGIVSSVAGLPRAFSIRCLMSTTCSRLVVSLVPPGFPLFVFSPVGALFLPVAAVVAAFAAASSPPTVLVHLSLSWISPALPALALVWFVVVVTVAAVAFVVRAVVVAELAFVAGVEAVWVVVDPVLVLGYPAVQAPSGAAVVPAVGEASETAFAVCHAGQWEGGIGRRDHEGRQGEERARKGRGEEWHVQKCHVARLGEASGKKGPLVVVAVGFVLVVEFVCGAVFAVCHAGQWAEGSEWRGHGKT